MNLIADFFDLEIPKGKGDNVFSAKTIKGYPNSKIGVNSFSYPVILIHSKNDGTFLKSKNIRLKYLELAHNMECKVMELGKSKMDYFTVIKFKSDNENLQRYFLGVSETLIKSLSETPTQKEVLQHFQNFVEVFQSISDSPKKSLQGLWAELFLIAKSKTPETLLNFWHSNPEEKFDFNSDTEKLEVKSSSSLESIHTFSSEQLNPPHEKQVIIVSLFTKQNPKGQNLEELVEIIRKRINSDELEEKLFRLVAKVLGNTIEQSLKVKYDYELATNSLRFYNVKDISKIEKVHIPYNVSEVRYKSDLSEIDHISRNELKQYGKFYESV